SYDSWTPLILAAHGKKMEIAKLLMERGARPDIFSELMMGDETAAAARLRDKPDLANSLGPNKSTPLYWVTSAKMAQALLDAGARTDVVDVYDQTPLESACRGKDRELVELLIARGGKLDAWMAAATADLDRLGAIVNADPAALEASKSQGVRAGETPLHAAARAHLDVTLWLLHHGAKVNARDKIGATALHHAAASGRLEIVKTLVERGADASICDFQHDSDARGWARFQYEAFKKPQCAEVVEFLARIDAVSS
ncbi:MAG: ankyrin repeat domain-containing protein, partial [Tepidisphaeraceae bacterium]